MKKRLRWIGISLVIVFCAIQLVVPPRDNPPVDHSATITTQPDLPPQISARLRASCFDCHSNETRWPWYSYVAPVSWLVADDVETGRHHLNFSEWGKFTPSKKVVKLGQIYEQVSMGEMPLQKYLYMHSDARLTPADRDSLMHWAEQERDKLTGGDD